MAFGSEFARLGWPTRRWTSSCSSRSPSWSGPDAATRMRSSSRASGCGWSRQIYGLDVNGYRAVAGSTLVAGSYVVWAAAARAVDGGCGAARPATGSATDEDAHPDPRGCIATAPRAPDRAHRAPPCPRLRDRHRRRGDRGRRAAACCGSRAGDREHRPRRASRAARSRAGATALAYQNQQLVEIDRLKDDSCRASRTSCARRSSIAITPAAARGGDRTRKRGHLAIVERMPTGCSLVSDLLLAARLPEGRLEPSSGRRSTCGRSPGSASTPRVRAPGRHRSASSSRRNRPEIAVIRRSSRSCSTTSSRTRSSSRRPTGGGRPCGHEREAVLISIDTASAFPTRARTPLRSLLPRSVGA